MATFGDGSDQFSDDEFGLSPLPKDDRLWRHPSELAGEISFAAHDTLAVRKRWIEREKHRGSAWTVGVVGALLATGLVVLGTHLATAFTSPPNDPDPVTSTTVLSSSQLALAGTGSIVDPTARLSTSMATRIRSVGKSVAVIDVGRYGLNVRCLGIVIRQDGILMAPAADVDGATSLLVTLSNGVQYVGVPEGSDLTSGIAIIRINGVDGLSPATLSSSNAATGTMALAVTASGGSSYSLGLIAEANVAAGSLVDALSTDVPADSAPLGSAILGTQGDLVGMVTGTSSTGVVATPAWLAGSVANELIATDRVVHGWIGLVDGATYERPGTSIPAGVTIKSIAPKSAAAKAGMRAGDIIVAVNNRPAQTLAMLRGRLYLLAPTTTVRLGMIRHHERITLSVHLDKNGPGQSS